MAMRDLSDRPLVLQVSEKGGLSVYGLQRFPVTLYKQQWMRLLDAADEIRAFMKKNDRHLATKSTSAPASSKRATSSKPSRSKSRSSADARLGALSRKLR